MCWTNQTDFRIRLNKNILFTIKKGFQDNFDGLNKLYEKINDYIQFLYTNFKIVFRNFKLIIVKC